jgi:hypothetical protein
MRGNGTRHPARQQPGRYMSKAAAEKGIAIRSRRTRLAPQWSITPGSRCAVTDREPQNARTTSLPVRKIKQGVRSRFYS